MYTYKINLIDGISYTVKSMKNNINNFIEELYSSDVCTYELVQDSPRDRFVAIVSNKVISVEH